MDEIEDVKSDWKVKPEIQKSLLGHLSEEIQVARKNNEKTDEDFDVFYNMVHCIRNRKPNEWEADIALSDYTSRLLTQIGNFAAQYFSSTDYVEADIDSEDAKDVMEAKAAKRLLNILLKDPDAYYFHKVIRLINFVFNTGYGIIKGGYRQRVNSVFSHVEYKSEVVTDPMTGAILADDGMPFADPMMQRPAYNQIEDPIYIDKPEIDKPIFDVYPNKCVLMSPEYCYSLNDKEFVIFTTERTLSQLKDEQEEMGYFNLEFLEKIVPEGKRGEDTYNHDGEIVPQPQPPEKTYILYERWGTYPCKQGKDGEYVPAIDEQGQFEDDYELHECIIHTVSEPSNDAPEYVIGFRKSKHSRRPMVRFLCYVDMVDDNGFGDGAVNRETQIAIDDNYNLMAKRIELATKPAFKGKKFAGIPEKIRIDPNHVNFLENIQDIEQWVIDGNIQPGIFNHNLLSSHMDISMATGPITMGMEATRGETATVASIQNQRASIRIGMKSMNLEFIGFSEFYRMLLTLCNDFMLSETLEELIGKDLAMAYNPKRKDKFKPVSQALETEESKQFKIKTLSGLYGQIAPIQNPKTAMTLNMVLGEILETLGKNYKHIKKFLLDDDPNNIALYQAYTGSKGMGTPMMGQNPMAPPSNQNGMPQRGPEQAARANAPQQ